jgi:predicted enzyme related to lactoylglutathione lyase
MAKKKAKAGKSKSKPKPAARKSASKPAKKGTPKKSSRRAAVSKASSQSASAASGGMPSGPFVWHELATTDANSCKKFYSKMFGWTSEDTEMMPGFTYTMLKANGKEIGGMMQMTPEWGDVKPHWLQYVAVNDVDDAAQRAESLGGQISVPPHDIPVGRFAVLRDPSGAAIAIYKSNQG